MEAALLLTAGAFALLNGVNDGGTLVAMGVKIPSVPHGAGLIGLTAAVVVVPLLFGTAVAVTLAERLVSFEGRSGEVAVLAAVVAAMAVVAVLAHLSLPTSLTLALVGGLTGAGWAAGLSVSWTMVAFVLGMAAVAPLAGGLLAYLLTRLAALLSAPRGAAVAVQRGHQLAFAAQAAAYGANDGQKMLAVFMVATGAVATGPSIWLLVVIGMLFLAGTVIGVRKFSGTMATGVLPARPLNALVAETSSAAAVMVSAVIGAPVSMTQAVAGGLVGTGMSDGLRRVRWRTALQIGVAWGLTLPMAVLTAAGVAAVVSVWV